MGNAEPRGLRVAPAVSRPQSKQHGVWRGDEMTRGKRSAAFWGVNNASPSKYSLNILQ